MSDYNDGIIPEPCLRLDYGFGQEYASVELGDGTGYVRVTDELRGEYHKMQRWYDDVLKEALDENAKLREFASELLVGVCDVCAFPPCDECEVYATARELGIEVPD